ncbi:uncharacterized protein Dwil_GK11996 [Drosophila willistoni]|uniref:CHK kinase-like domain-containing protein n=2 Tax=Drosophila willistoni TaxID=7260 RepID=B4N856_DROWI|nr:uncharacterized protein Dwil_GK11996 [Drosophila willistoni]
MGSRSSKPKRSYNVQPVGQRTSSATTIDVQDKPEVKTTPSPSPSPAPTSATAGKPPAAVEIDTKLVPVWLNESQFVDILKANVPQFSKIRSFTVKPAMGAGENYATLMLRVTIDVELTDKQTKNVSYMMKVAHDSPEMQQMLQLANFFVSENAAYTEVLPKLDELYKSKGIDIKFAPSAYKLDASEEPKLANTVVMYDLGQDGYGNLNRLECLDLDQTKFALRKLAQFHAAGARFVEVHGLYCDMFLYGMFGTNKELGKMFMEQFMGPLFKLFLKNLSTYKDGEKYRQKFEKFFSELGTEIFNLIEYNPDEFNVLNHGDCWLNNLLFKKGPNQELLDMIFVDFQNPKYGSPAQDLLYFIFTSVKIEHKLKDFDFLIRYYYEQLVEQLNVLGYEGRQPSLRELHMQLYKYGTWAVTASFMVLPVVILDPNSAATMENFIGDSEAGDKFKNLLYSNPRYREQIEQIMPWLDNRGLLKVYEAPVKIDPILTVDEKSINVPDSDKIFDWLNVSDFGEIVASTEPTFDKIVSGTSELATKPGDNYASILLKVDIDVQLKDNSLKTKSYIVKVNPNHAIDFSAFNLFPKEIEVYANYVTAFEKLYTDAGQPVQFSPRSYRLQKKDVQVEYLILDNLKSVGFKMCDRMKGMDLEHTKQTLKKLAQWHAASLKYKELNGPYPEKFNNGIFSEQTAPIFKAMLAPSKKTFIETVSQFEGINEFKDKVDNLFEVYVESIIEDAKIDDNDFNVLNHGDAWINNIMFQYHNDGQIKETYLLDHQVGKYGSPAQDLYYFLMSSTQLDIKVEKFDYFIRWYHENLVESAKLLNYNGFVPTLKELQIILLKHPIFGPGTVCSTLTICLAETNEDFKPDLLMSDSPAAEALRKTTYGNERYKAHFELVMPWLNKRGLLDADNFAKLQS